MVQHKGHHLKCMRFVQISGGKKKATTSLEMAVSVVIAPHQIFVRRACSKRFCGFVLFKLNWHNKDKLTSEWKSPQEGNIDYKIFILASCYTYEDIYFTCELSSPHLEATYVKVNPVMVLSLGFVPSL